MSKTAHLIGKTPMLSWSSSPIKCFFGIKTMGTVLEAAVEQGLKVCVPVLLLYLAASISLCRT